MAKRILTESKCFGLTIKITPQLLRHAKVFRVIFLDIKIVPFWPINIWRNSFAILHILFEQYNEVYQQKYL